MIEKGVVDVYVSGDRIAFALPEIAPDLVPVGWRLLRPIQYEVSPVAQGTELTKILARLTAKDFYIPSEDQQFASKEELATWGKRKVDVFRDGDQVIALHMLLGPRPTSEWRNAVISAVNADGTYTVRWADTRGEVLTSPSTTLDPEDIRRRSSRGPFSGF